MLIYPLFKSSDKTIYNKKLGNKLGKKAKNILNYKIYLK